jgi:hypothetical protein
MKRVEERCSGCGRREPAHGFNFGNCRPHGWGSDRKPGNWGLAAEPALSFKEGPASGVPASPAPAMQERMKIKIVSGGPTGGDRAALDWAIQHECRMAAGAPKGGRRKTVEYQRAT